MITQSCYVTRSMYIYVCIIRYSLTEIIGSVRTKHVARDVLSFPGPLLSLRFIASDIHDFSASNIYNLDCKNFSK